MKSKKTIKEELLFKERRVSYWEQFGVVPSKTELAIFNDKYLEVRI